MWYYRVCHPFTDSDLTLCLFTLVKTMTYVKGNRPFPNPQKASNTKTSSVWFIFGPCIHINGEDPLISWCGSCCNRESRIIISLKTHILQAAVSCLCLNKPGTRKSTKPKHRAKSKSKLNCISTSWHLKCHVLWI